MVDGVIVSSQVVEDEDEVLVLNFSLELIIRDFGKSNW